jgi:hypothetical protein
MAIHITDHTKILKIGNHVLATPRFGRRRGFFTFRAGLSAALIIPSSSAC